jgi:hypothetical protein
MRRHPLFILCDNGHHRHRRFGNVAGCTGKLFKARIDTLSLQRQPFHEGQSLRFSFWDSEPRHDQQEDPKIARFIAGIYRYSRLVDKSLIQLRVLRWRLVETGSEHRFEEAPHAGSIKFDRIAAARRVL